MTRYDEDRIIWIAEKLEAGEGVRMQDDCCTRWDLTNVSHRTRAIFEAAADLAGVEIEMEKLGEQARCRVAR